jgi:hypothetical protein
MNAFQVVGIQQVNAGIIIVSFQHDLESRTVIKHVISAA